MALSKVEMEELGEGLRKELQIEQLAPLDPFKIKFDDVKYLTIREIPGLDLAAIKHLETVGQRQWSAMSVPLDSSQEKWAIIYNHTHEKARQNVSLLEELWHILQGHKLTAIVRVGSEFGRGFEGEEEHDAYYLAAATLFPRRAVKEMIENQEPVASVCAKYEVSKDLVEYRIKRLGYWNRFEGRSLTYGN